MAELVLSRIGAATGGALLPNGASLFGAKLSGAAIGSAVGTFVGGAIGAPVRDGPRIETLALMESREGAGIPSIYGRMRVSGQLIWAARFKERSRDRRVAGKGSAKVREYGYSASFAVALCEGEATRIGRVWANGEPFDLGGATWRFYSGADDQLPDPLIEAIEGESRAPAYRGTSYVVFEDLPLDAFGNRLPQLSFEVFRAAPQEGENDTLRDLIRGVNIIPASGEFAYDTEIIRTRKFPGIEAPQNVHGGRSASDFSVSMDQLQADLPGVDRAALTVGWFGNDLRAGLCEIRPGVELAAKDTVPETWRAGGVERSSAHLISQDASGHAHYGGTPSDASVIRALRDLASRGIQPVVTPFLFMDVPPGNGLVDPYGASEQAAFPWRGRITGNEDDVQAFLGSAALSDFSVQDEEVIYTGPPDDWGYRRFILHNAHLAKISGVAEAFLIGSEMVAMSRVRAGDGSFPFVDGLVHLAGEVKSLLGPGVKVSYAADWTEYCAYVDGSDVFFPLDALWASPAIDFVGVDWYPPMADWRDGDGHLDAIAGYEGPEDPAYLLANINGGEGYDWFYASAADRDAQTRTPIIDTAHGEHWLFRQKDLASWWSNAHHERPGGMRSAQPTLWVPGSKPVRLMEIGFPALDKGANAPNLFYDPKSSESALPPFSNGTRDDLQQRRALETALGHWQAEGMVEAAYVWCWDARPFPAYPSLEVVWADGANWHNGHWLNGRVGASELGRVVQDICMRGGVEADSSQLRGIVEGYRLGGVHSVRDALEPLRAAFGFDLVERGGALVFQMQGVAATEVFDANNLVGDGLRVTRKLLDKRPGALRLTYISANGAYAPESVEARDMQGDRSFVIELSLPVVLAEPQAEILAGVILQRSLKGDTASAAVSLSALGLEPGDRLQISGSDQTWQVDEIEDDGIVRALSLKELSASPEISRSTQPAVASTETSLSSVPELIIIDALAGAPLVAASGKPWPADVRVVAGPDVSRLRQRAAIEAPAIMGLVLEGAECGPLGRWDHAASLLVSVPGGDLSSVSTEEVLAGANQLLVGTETGWELLAIRSADLVEEDRYRLTGLLRGLQGTTAGVIPSGAKIVLFDESAVTANLSAEEIGIELLWRVEAGGESGEAQPHAFMACGMLAYRPGHLRIVPKSGQFQLSWTRRGPDVPQSWSLPEADNGGQFRVEIWNGGAMVSAQNSSTPNALIDLTGSETELRVAEIGSDGRPGAFAVLPISHGLT